MIDKSSTENSGEQQNVNRKLSRQYRWRILFVLCLGMLAGVGSFTFGYGNGASYLSNDPQACANCHAMQDHLDSWTLSSHHHVAVCNDCHLPHDPIRKWVTKADNGFFHSLAFTLGNYKDPIQIKHRNKVIAQNSCLYCHGDFVHQTVVLETNSDNFAGVQSCVHCHSDVGHAGR